MLITSGSLRVEMGMKKVFLFIFFLQQSLPKVFMFYIILSMFLFQ